MPVPRHPTVVPAPPDWGPLPSFEVSRRFEIAPRLTLTLGHGPPAPTVLWVRSAPPSVVVGELLAAVGPVAADGYEMMAVGDHGWLTLVRAVRKGVVSPWPDGFCESAVSRLYLPVSRRLHPVVPLSLSPPDGFLCWLTDDGRPTFHTAELAFRPTAESWTASAPSVRQLAAVGVVSPFDQTIPHLEAASRASPSVPSGPTIAAAPKPPIRSRLRTALPRFVAALAPTTTARPVEATPSDLRDLEGQLVAVTANRTPVDQAALWAKLAAGYRAAGRETDATVCWLNAAWCHPNPPAKWPQRWREDAEVMLDGREADVPVRAVWLARLARHEYDGDGLALARCRDRLLARLATGPELDLDVPSFLRRTDRRPEPEAARGWLAGAGELVRKWLGTCMAATKLTAAGLDADRSATRCYAELIRAWGLATVGDRSALGLATATVAELRVLKRPSGTDPVVHRLLGDCFLGRVRAALTGQPDAPPPPFDHLASLDRYAVDRLLAGCECLGSTAEPTFDTPAKRVAHFADAARLAHRPDSFRTLLDTLDPTNGLAAAVPLFRSAHALNLTGEAAGLLATLSALQPTPGGRRDLGLAVGRYLAGDIAGGDRSLDAARHRLFVAGVPDRRIRGEWAVAYATAVGHVAPGTMIGRLDELFHRLGPVSAQGACGRYFALLPLRVVDAAVRAAVGDDFAPSPAVKKWLADEEWHTRRRIHRDVRRVFGATPP